MLSKFIGTSLISVLLLVLFGCSDSNAVTPRHIQVSNTLCKDHGGVLSIAKARSGLVDLGKAQVSSYSMTVECANHLQITPKFMVAPEGAIEYIN